MMEMTPTAAGSSSGSGDNAGLRKNKRPKYSRFSQQELPACKPILTPHWVISIFAIVGTIFIPIGTVSLRSSRDVVEIKDQYDESCFPNSTINKVAYIQDPTTRKDCIRRYIVPKDMNSPVYVYYELDNFYQNHRRYVKSRNDEQLRDASRAGDIKGCEPEKQAKDGSPIVPCGLIAWSLFNDTYSFIRNKKPLPVNKQGISWKSDREHKFGRDVYPKNFQNGELIGGGKLDPDKPLNEQEDLIVWMRTAPLSNFRKLYGKIEVDLKANEMIIVTVQNNYNTYSFGGKKSLVLSTTTWLGGKNDFLGIAYLTVGGLCFFMAVAFAVIYLIKPRKLGDPSYLSWNSRTAGH